jgi:hypothetical protein
VGGQSYGFRPWYVCVRYPLIYSVLDDDNIGCGIGVLLRMFWVFAIVMIRVVGGNRTCQYIPVAVRAEDLMVPPPNYVFEDVKTPVVVGDVKTPVVLEEVKKTAEDESK